jgi:hypothetical protein
MPMVIVLGVDEPQGVCLAMLMALQREHSIAYPLEGGKFRKVKLLFSYQTGEPNASTSPSSPEELDSPAADV